MCILWYIDVCVGIFIYGYVYILDFSFYIGCIYIILKLLNVYKFQENEEENSKTSPTGSFSSPVIFASRQRH